MQVHRINNTLQNNQSFGSHNFELSGLEFLRNQTTKRNIEWATQFLSKDLDKITKGFKSNTSVQVDSFQNVKFTTISFTDASLDKKFKTFFAAVGDILKYRLMFGARPKFVKELDIKRDYCINPDKLKDSVLKSLEGAKERFGV